jgi:hypothetical protein
MLGVGLGRGIKQDEAKGRVNSLVASKPVALGLKAR